MTPRTQFDRELNALRDTVIQMGLAVDSQLQLALQALKTLDTELAQQVVELDQDINDRRFSIEEVCFRLIVTQQPAARDLRTIIAAINIIVDLERAGDKAKDIANTIPHILTRPKSPRPPELWKMGNLVRTMLQQCMQAYTAENGMVLAQEVAQQAVKLDVMFDEILSQTIEHMAKAKKEKKITATFGVMRAAQHLDRIGGLVTNVAERIIYIMTGNVEEIKSHNPDSAE